MIMVIYALIHAFNKHLAGSFSMADSLVCTVDTKKIPGFCSQNLLCQHWTLILILTPKEEVPLFVSKWKMELQCTQVEVQAWGKAQSMNFLK